MTRITIDSPMTPPHWALLERELLRVETAACEAFYEHYFDDRGYLLCVPRWGGDDGPDDAAENQLNWTMLHALGASDSILAMWKEGWEGHLRQYTEAKTVEVPMGRDGMYYKEFPVMFDWFHHAEGYSAFFLQGLSDPYDATYLNRLKRYSAMYMGDDPGAPNYDPEHRVIRSMFNGSRGPLLRKATGLDWAGDPIEIEGRFRLGHGERNFQEMLDHFKDYNDVAGDNPLNLSATTLGLKAYMLTGEERYRDWVLEYVDAWVDRTEQNNGLIPSNVGLDGSLGGECDGKWYGGVYGWGFSVIVPQTGALAHRGSFRKRAHYGFANALLLTGDQRYVDTWRGMYDIVNSNAKTENGQTLYPHMYGEEGGNEAGWYHFLPEPFAPGAEEIYYWSMDEADRERLGDNGWVNYLTGSNPNYPVEALQGDLETVRHRMARMAADTASPDTRLSDDMNSINPAITDALIQLMLGGLPVGRVGFPLHCRLRYFDPARRRAGIPEDVAALVSAMSDDSVTVTLVNLHPVEARTVIVQGGAYGEHQIESVSGASVSGIEVEGAHFAVRLEPGCGAQLDVGMTRYANAPTMAFPWV